MVAFRQRKTTGQFSDDSDYKAVLEPDALYLIVEGQKLLAGDNKDYYDVNEEDITGDLTEATNNFINSLPSPDWTKHYHIQEERRENTKGKKGKHRKRVDIACVLSGRKPHQVMKFEAKRLRKPGFTAGTYVGKEGLGEFISGNYAPESNTVGMLGYVQSDDCDHWSKQISAKINEKKKEVHLLKGAHWQKAGFKKITHCYETQHNRPTVKRKLTVFHLLLDFV